MKIIINSLEKILSSTSRKTLLRFGELLGSIFYHILKHRQNVVRRNMEVIGIKPDNKTVKKVFKNNFASFMEIFYIHRTNDDFIKKNVIYTDESQLKNFLDQNDTYILASAHLGSWELAPTICSEIFSTKLAVIGRRIKNKNVNDLVYKLRNTENVDYLLHRNITSEIYKHLSDRTPVGVLLDHSAVRKDSIFVNFFGLKTTFNAGIPAICVRKNIPVLPCFFIREKDKIKMIHYPAIFPDKNLKPKERIKTLAREINKVYEDIISEYPQQWFLLHKRFKRLERHDGKDAGSIY